LVGEKRFDHFISVLAHVRKNSTRPVHATIVGPSDSGRDLQRQLQQQAAGLGLGPEALEFRGAVSNLAPVYQEADLCVLTSNFEGTPNVLMEAMARGLPVVAIRVGGVPDLVREGETGFTVEPDCENALGATLLRLVRDDGLRRAMWRQGRAYIEERYSSNRLPVFLRDLCALAFS
jgi:glycosyltransferase involved in cell wall biosynthesis